MTSPEKPIDIFYKRYVELHVIKQNGLTNYLDIQRKDMTFVKKNKETSWMWLRGQYIPRICREISTRLYMTSRHNYRHENFKYLRRLLHCLGTVVIHFHNTSVTKSTAALCGCCWTSSWSTNQLGAPVVTVSVEHYFLKKSTKYKAVKPPCSPSSESLRSRKLGKAEEWPCLCGTSLSLEEASKQASLQNLRLSTRIF